jgi:hypothetical protein
MGDLVVLEFIQTNALNVAKSTYERLRNTPRKVD